MLTTFYQRHENAVANSGALTTANARVSYAAAWCDSLGRTTKTVDYGNNEGTAFVDLGSDIDPVADNTQPYAEGGSLPGSMRCIVTEPRTK